MMFMEGSEVGVQMDNRTPSKGKVGHLSRVPYEKIKSKQRK